MWITREPPAGTPGGRPVRIPAGKPDPVSRAHKPDPMPAEAPCARLAGGIKPAPSEAPMRRREFITLLGGAAVAWPLAVRAQQPVRMRRIGVLLGATEDDSGVQPGISAFRRALEELGWSEGRNVR